jgi:hypothetical protein
MNPRKRNYAMRPMRYTSLLLAAFVAGVGACKSLDEPDFNASSLSDLATKPTAASIGTAATGLLVGSRGVHPFPQFSFTAIAGELGREGYSLDPSNPNITVSRLQSMDQATGAGSLWQAVYRNIKQAAVVIKAVDGVPGFSAQQKAAVKGYAKTLQAMDLLVVVDLFDNAGAVTQFDVDPSAPVPPLDTRDNALKKVSDLLDEAKTDLSGGGTAFPYNLSAGFTGFDTPGSFLKFNRALKARVEVYRTNYAAAITALGESFLDVNAPLTLGPAHTFSSNSGDLSNPLYDPLPRIIFAHPATLTEAQSNASAVKDLRATGKVVTMTQKQVNGVLVNSKFTMYPGPSATIPIIRNEELILLRAEAEWFTGAKAGAVNDLNLVRTTSGGLQACGVVGSGCTLTIASTDAQFIDALLYERRYSLLFEGGHRWIDNRRFGRLGTLPKALPAHVVYPRFLLPDDECVARTPTPAGCSAATPF